MLQTAAVAVVVATFPDNMRIVPTVPWWLDRAIVVVGGIWLVNVVNFMDGVDWMTVAEVIPVTAGLALFGFLGALPPSAALVAVALCGAVVGFAPFNRPVAQLFLGDVGSLPIGLLLGWLLALLAGSGHFSSAVLLPLYYLADATVTLLHRFAKGERSRKRTAVISISRRSTAGSAFTRSSAAFFCLMSCLRAWLFSRLRNAHWQCR